LSDLGSRSFEGLRITQFPDSAAVGGRPGSPAAAGPGRGSSPGAARFAPGGEPRTRDAVEAAASATRPETSSTRGVDALQVMELRRKVHMLESEKASEAVAARQERERLLRQITALSEENKKMRPVWENHEREVSDKVASMTQEQRDAITQLERKHAEVLQDKDARLAALEEAVAASGSETERQLAEHGAATAREVQDLRTALAEAKAAAEAATQRVEEEQLRVAEAREELGQAKVRQGEYFDKLTKDSWERQHKAIQEKAAECEQHHESRTEELRAELESHRQQVAQLSQGVEAKASEAQAISSQVAEATAARDEAQKQLRECEVRLREAAEREAQKERHLEDHQTLLQSVDRLRDRHLPGVGAGDPHQVVARLDSMLSDRAESFRSATERRAEFSAVAAGQAATMRQVAGQIFKNEQLIELYRSLEDDRDKEGPQGLPPEREEAMRSLRDLSTTCSQVMKVSEGSDLQPSSFTALLQSLQGAASSLAGELLHQRFQYRSARQVTGQSIASLLDAVQTLSTESKALMFSTRRMAKVIAVRTLLNSHDRPQSRTRRDGLYAVPDGVGTPRAAPEERFDSDSLYGKGMTAMSPRRGKLTRGGQSASSGCLPSPRHASPRRQIPQVQLDVDLGEIKQQFQSLDAALSRALAQSKTARSRLAQLDVLENTAQRGWSSEGPRRPAAVDGLELGNGMNVSTSSMGSD